ncbi:isochorismate-pyruvate lyase [Pantoea rodasii]|uniref:chorismate mutase n=1 Tax=Pantoea rodasii TaxID=1076549 RepID=A0A0B1R0R5_9GAMM|nr:isochorismate lyase [Pantoea rodasii]KHJ66234.1 isochorismate-pyruvate lyase [Pantoea rodasii]
MIAAKECKNLLEIRDGIDAIDHQIVSLLQQRLEYVLNAAQFKPSVESIPAPDRVAHMLTARQRWAQEKGLDPTFISELFHHIIPWYIATQTAHWQRKHR